jgi:hypothetical protein
MPHINHEQLVHFALYLALEAKENNKQLWMAL